MVYTYMSVVETIRKAKSSYNRTVNRFHASLHNTISKRTNSIIPLKQRTNMTGLNKLCPSLMSYSAHVFNLSLSSLAEGCLAPAVASPYRQPYSKVTSGVNVLRYCNGMVTQSLIPLALP